MAQGKSKQEFALQELIAAAKQLNIDVRSEKLMREVGYRPRSGRCRLRGQDLIILDRDASISEQVDFLTNELSQRKAAGA